MKTFTDYWKSLTPDQKTQLSKGSGIDQTYLSNIANGHRNAGWRTISRLTRADKNICVGMFPTDEDQKAS